MAYYLTLLDETLRKDCLRVTCRSIWWLREGGVCSFINNIDQKVLKLLFWLFFGNMNKKWSTLWFLETVLLYCTSTPFQELLSCDVLLLEIIASEGIAVPTEDGLAERLFIGISHTSSGVDGCSEVLVGGLSEPSLKDNGFLFWFVLTVVKGFDGGCIISYSFSFLHFVDKVLADGVL